MRAYRYSVRCWSVFRSIAPSAVLPFAQRTAQPVRTAESHRMARHGHIGASRALSAGRSSKDPGPRLGRVLAPNEVS
jgi:hypothetical protein